GGTGRVPAVVTTRLPGAVHLPGSPQEGWLRILAEVAVAIAAVPAGRFPWTYDPWIAVEPQVPDGGSALWDRALEVVSRARPAGPVVLLHRDHHPMNLLFGGGRLTGVVDWVNACVGPAAVDVAHCRLNLAGMYGPEVADRFRDLWCGLTRLRYDPVWDVVTLVGMLPIRPYAPWAAAGLAVGASEMRPRLERVLATALDALGA
ncbi:MAG: aminoglycoside phosphotransferase family protein, partial [Actinobacteria bacterium]|nr:aminoglycoside phosphotransferase family protein [Actinomycetota bacterium]NIU64496.1 aminoglycoside phosphotransferase family protein [Actinomycetota bacterium]NIV54430.1 phosphotransferase [Actinomycetota bacterium]